MPTAPSTPSPPMSEQPADQWLPIGANRKLVIAVGRKTEQLSMCDDLFEAIGWLCHTYDVRRMNDPDMAWDFKGMTTVDAVGKQHAFDACVKEAKDFIMRHNIVVVQCNWGCSRSVVVGCTAARLIEAESYLEVRFCELSMIRPELVRPNVEEMMSWCKSSRNTLEPPSQFWNLDLTRFIKVHSTAVNYKELAYPGTETWEFGDAVAVPAAPAATPPAVVANVEDDDDTEEDEPPDAVMQGSPWRAPVKGKGHGKAKVQSKTAAKTSEKGKASEKAAVPIEEEEAIDAKPAWVKKGTGKATKGRRPGSASSSSAAAAPAEARSAKRHKRSLFDDTDDEVDDGQLDEKIWAALDPEAHKALWRLHKKLPDDFSSFMNKLRRKFTDLTRPSAFGIACARNAIVKAQSEGRYD